MLVSIACALGRFVIADICQKQNRVCLWHMSITKNQKPQNSLPKGLSNALKGKNIFFKTAGCLKEKKRTSALTCGHAHRGTNTGHVHVGNAPALAHAGTLRPTLWHLCAQGFSVKACMRAGCACASGMGAFKLRDQGGSSRVGGRHETGVVKVRAQVGHNCGAQMCRNGGTLTVTSQDFGWSRSGHGAGAFLPVCSSAGFSRTRQIYMLAYIFCEE